MIQKLEKVEADLQANVDLVSTLESALMDSERTLRKSRTQMNEMAREKDDLHHANDTLRENLRERIQIQFVLPLFSLCSTEWVTESALIV